MEQSHSLETSKSSANLEISTSLLTVNVYYCFRGGPPRVHIWNRMALAHNNPIS